MVKWLVIAVVLLVILKILFSCGGDSGGKGKSVKAEPPVLPNFILSDSSDRFWINNWGPTSGSFWADCHDGELCYIAEEYVDKLLAQGYTIEEYEEDGGNTANQEWLEAIRNSPYSVISMQEFLEWRFGTRLLPEECILITLDDGWKSVYTDAYPIFKEYGYPFHLFLYTDYLHGKGESMNHDMIREMLQNGASIGSHSHTHPYPSDWNKHRALGEDAYYEFIDKEIGESKVKLDKLFGTVNTYCYPGGFNDQEMLSRLPSYGYVAAFTVIPGKATSTEIPFQIHRYMVFGTDPSIFNNAMDFSVAEVGSAISTGSQPGTLPKNTAKPPFAVTPQPDSTVSCTIPAITAQLSSVPGINMSTVRMRVSSFGHVRPTINTAERTVTWTPPCRIYMPNISVHLTWETTDGAKGHAEWSFSIDRSVTAE